MLLFGPPNVGKLKAKRNVKGLIKALGYKKEADVRRSAAQALGEIGDTQAVAPLGAALKDADLGVRNDAIVALGRIRDPEVVTLLSEVLVDSDSDVRLVAAQVLGEIGDIRAVEPLLTMLKDEANGMPQVVATALDNLGWQPDSSKSGATYWIVKRQWDRCIEIGDPAVEPLIDALKDRDQGVRIAAVGALGQIGNTEAVAPLGEALKDTYPDVRYAAIAALSTIRDPEVVTLLSEALMNSDSKVRESAAQVLGEIGDVRAVKPLIQALQSREPHVRKAAAEALKKTDLPANSDALTQAWYAIAKGNLISAASLGAPAVNPLINVIKYSGERRTIELAMDALTRIDDPHAVEDLVAALKDADANVYRPASWALHRIGLPSVSPIIAALDDIRSKDACGEATGTLLGICKAYGTRAIELHIAALSDPRVNVRGYVARILGGAGSVSAIQPLAAIMKTDSALPVRRTAAFSLGEIRNAQAVEPLIQAFRDEDWGIRKLAAEALGKIGDTDAVGPLIIALKDWTSGVSQTSIEHEVHDYGWGKVAIATNLQAEARDCAISSLKALTGQNFGKDVTSWEQWWENSK